MMDTTFQTTCIGHIAILVLQRNEVFQVVGSTSRGLYLQPENDLVLFLTEDPFRGPLTVNIRNDSGGRLSILPWDMARRLGKRLVFTNSDQSLAIQSPLVWEPPKLPDRYRRIKPQFSEVFEQVSSLFPDHPYLPLLGFSASGKLDLFEAMPDLAGQIVVLFRSLGSGIPSEVISGMKSFLGLGPGLTPLGDDLLIGTILTINRSRKFGVRAGDLERIYHQVLRSAKIQTTKLSWSLLSCSVQGSGDERIIRVLDRLLASQAVPDQDMISLLNWGSSSGMAVLAGMLLVLSI
jgi:hypothetical protein